jgi:uncharacterized membrane protein YjjB (DUF3815 family)
MEWMVYFEKGIWFGFAALGFAILFNVPVRTLVIIWLMGALGGLIKVALMQWGVGVVLSSLVGATFIGIVSVFAAQNKQAPPMVFAIPAVIPMVPGVFAYRMMLGLIKMAGDSPAEMQMQVLSETVNNGLKAMFILMALAAGVAIPMLITRKESVLDVKLNKKS